MQNITEIVHSTILGVLMIDVSKLTPEANLIEELGADSLDLVQLAQELEERFGKEIDDDEMMKVKTVGDVIALVERVTEST